MNSDASSSVPMDAPSTAKNPSPAMAMSVVTPVPSREPCSKTRSTDVACTPPPMLVFRNAPSSVWPHVWQSAERGRRVLELGCGSGYYGDNQ